MTGISGKDWKLFQFKIASWQERYMGKLVKEYMEILKSQTNASKRFWDLEKRIKVDRKHPGVILEISKQDALMDIVRLIRFNVITMDDLEDFSDELKEKVKKSLELLNF